MITTYSYSISLNIPGGLVTSNTVVRLTALCRINITTSLAYIKTIADTLFITFTNALTSGEKIILDGDTLPAGGLLEQCADYVEAKINNITVLDNETIPYPSDGFSHVDVLLQLKKGNGTDGAGVSPAVRLETIGVLLVDKENGFFDSITGKYSFRLMPSSNRIRGLFALRVNTENLPPRLFIIHTED